MITTLRKDALIFSMIPGNGIRKDIINQIETLLDTLLEEKDRVLQKAATNAGQSSTRRETPKVRFSLAIGNSMFTLRRFKILTRTFFVICTFSIERDGAGHGTHGRSRTIRNAKEPCGVPITDFFSLLPSITPAFSHLSIILRITPSVTRWSKKFLN